MNPYQQVLEFHRKFRLPIAQTPMRLPYDVMIGRVEMMVEELVELLRAYRNDDLPETADALIDLIYFALGTVAMMGLPFSALFSEVHDANMRKELNPTGDGKRRNKLDVVKPPGWQPPDVAGILAAYERRAPMYDVTPDGTDVGSSHIFPAHRPITMKTCVVCGVQITERGCRCETKEII